MLADGMTGCHTPVSQAFEQQVSEEYHEAVKRRLQIVTNEIVDDDKVDELIDNGQAETLFKQAMLQNRGQAVRATNCQRMICVQGSHHRAVDQHRLPSLAQRCKSGTRACKSCTKTCWSCTK